MVNGLRGTAHQFPWQVQHLVHWITFAGILPNPTMLKLLQSFIHVSSSRRLLSNLELLPNLFIEGSRSSFQGLYS